MTYASFKRKFCNISVINVYAPILSVDDSDKDKFYAELQLQKISLSKYAMVIIVKDWNALVGHDVAKELKIWQIWHWKPVHQSAFALPKSMNFLSVMHASSWKIVIS